MEIKMTHIKEVSVDPNMARCPVGSKFSSGKYVFADLCIFHKGIPHSKSYMNSEVLKAALLSNPELLASMRLKVIDLDEEIKKDLATDEFIPEEIRAEETPEVPEETPDQVEEKPAEVITVAVEVEPIDYEAMAYPTLVKYAKEQGMEFTTNPKKVDILAYLKSKE